MNPQRAWEIAHNQLEIQFDRASFDTWLKSITFLDYDEQEEVFTLGVHNSYALDMLQHRLYRNVCRVLSDTYGRDIHIHFELTKKPPVTMPMQPVQEQNADMPMFQYMARQPQQPTQPLHQQVAQPQWDDLPESDLNPRFTFERFIVNRANYMVYEAARAVADSPNGGYNPLMIYGGVGLGKTHLLQAIANDCRNRGLKIVYVPSEAFVNDLVLAIRRKQQAMFREKYRRADVLLVDDVQFIAGKESTQEEFFHTFNALYTFNKQIILASDRHPDELTTLEDRLRSRFSGGLIVDVQPPEFETRVAILEMWAQERGTTLDTATLEMIADRAPANIRELEGVFNQIMAKVRFAPGEMTTERVERTLDHFDRPRNHFAPITLQRVLEATAQQFRLEPSAITGKRRTKKVNIARQVGMYVAREMTDASLPQIGDAFGGRTHSTVLHSCNKIIDEMEYDLGVREHVERIQQILIGD